MNIKVKRTHEISDEEIIEIYDLFYKVFRKSEMYVFSGKNLAIIPKGIRIMHCVIMKTIR